MNPRLFMLLIASATILFSCTKEPVTPEKTLTNQQSAIQLIYPDESATESRNGRIVAFNPPGISQACKASTPSILIPRILVGNKIEVIYANIEQFVGNVNPKSIEWKVNGEVQRQLSTNLQLSYVLDEYFVETTVTLKNGEERSYEFTLNVTHDMPLDIEGFIEYDVDDICVTGEKVGKSCFSQNARAGVFVVVDPF